MNMQTPGNSESQKHGDSRDGCATGLPILRSWRSIYLFVLVLFVVYVGLLVALERAFP